MPALELFALLLLLLGSYLVLAYVIAADRAASVVPQPATVVPLFEPTPQGPTPAPARAALSSAELERAA